MNAHYRYGNGRDPYNSVDTYTPHVVARIERQMRESAAIVKLRQTARRALPENILRLFVATFAD